MMECLGGQEKRASSWREIHQGMSVTWTPHVSGKLFQHEQWEGTRDAVIQMYFLFSCTTSKASSYALSVTRYWSSWTSDLAENGCFHTLRDTKP